MGQILNLLVGLLLLPVSRNSVWTVVFGISWEAMVKFHTWMGSLLLLCIVCHIGLFWKKVDEVGDFPHDIFCIPTIYHGNNFTIPFAFLTTMLVFLSMGVLSMYPVRRYCYELFYWSHQVTVPILLLMMLWHATFAWYYITGGMVLWAVDHFIRLHRRVGLTASLMTAEVINVHCVINDCDVANVESKLLLAAQTISSSSPIVHLRYQVRPPVNLSKLAFDSFYSCFRAILNIFPYHHPESSDSTNNNKSLEEETKFLFEPGQYMFVNIPSVSELCWHPFSISSAPHDVYVSHHIKSMGGSQWTGRLVQLIASKRLEDAKEDSYQQVANASDQQFNSMHQDQLLVNIPINIPINIDGPYGMPLRYELYDNILLCAGGIGITPLHSLFRFLLHSWTMNRPSVAHIQSVHLVWATKHREEVGMFQDTWDNLSKIHSNIVSSTTDDTTNGNIIINRGMLFRVSIHVTAQQRSDLAVIDQQSRSAMSVNADIGIEDHKCMNRSGIYHCDSRPDFNKEVALMRMKGEKGRSVVLACGPSTLVDAVELACTREHVEFQKEVFLL